MPAPAESRTLGRASLEGLPERGRSPTSRAVPARRVPEASGRLIETYAKERQPDETAPAFFRRIGAARQKELLADLEQLLPAQARAEDFVDPGQDGGPFTVETKSGECAR